MKQLYTEIEIDAPVETVWEILFDTKHYSEWNPFIRSFGGEIELGKHFSVTIQNPGAKPMRFKPKCLKLEQPNEFRWIGHLLVPMLFDGEHVFELKELVGEKTRFIHREKFSGILVPLFWNGLNTKTRDGFISMNVKLKELAEKRNELHN